VPPDLPLAQSSFGLIKNHDQSFDSEIKTFKTVAWSLRHLAVKKISVDLASFTARCRVIATRSLPPKISK
jgi:hypothetical protein